MDTLSTYVYDQKKEEGANKIKTTPMLIKERSLNGLRNRNGNSDFVAYH